MLEILHEDWVWVWNGMATDPTMTLVKIGVVVWLALAFNRVIFWPFEQFRRKR